MTALPCPLLTGAGALAAETPRGRAVWIGQFLDALAAEAEDGIALLRSIESPWFAARTAAAGRRRDSRATQAVDLLGAAPLMSATTLGQALGMATKNATLLLDGFVRLGIATEITHRSKRRLYGLKHLTPLREVTRAPRRPQPAGRPGRPCAASLVDHTAGDAGDIAPAAALAPPLPPLARREFEVGDIDRLLDLTDQAIRRV